MIIMKVRISRDRCHCSFLLFFLGEEKDRAKITEESNIKGRISIFRRHEANWSEGKREANLVLSAAKLLRKISSDLFKKWQSSCSTLQSSPSPLYTPLTLPSDLPIAVLSPYPPPPLPPRPQWKAGANSRNFPTSPPSTGPWCSISSRRWRIAWGPSCTPALCRPM